MKTKGHIITGAPGTGKTSLIDAFQALGFEVLPEISREILIQEKAQGGEALPWVNHEAFHQAVLDGRIQQYETSQQLPAPVFLDRGVPDSFAYLLAEGVPVSENDFRWLKQFEYASVVFITPPWKEIYHGDEERWETFEHAQRIHEALVEVYTQLDFQVDILPKVPIPQRIDYILEQIR